MDKTLQVIAYKDNMPYVVDYKTSNFPAGEVYIKVLDVDLVKSADRIVVELMSAESNDIMRLLMLADAIKRLGNECKYPEYELSITYFPYGRQDRVVNVGESYSLEVFIGLISSVGLFNKVTVLDQHSGKTHDLLSDIIPTVSCHSVQYNTMPFYDVKTKENTFLDSTLFGQKYCIVSPDKGAVQRANKARKDLGVEDEVIVFDKVRDGDKVITTLKDEHKVLLEKADTLVVIDDLVDGGRTYMSLADSISEYNKSARLILVVTHGIFSAGIENLLTRYDAIYVHDNVYNRLRTTY